MSKVLRMSGSESSAQPPPPPQGAGSIAEEKVERMQELEHGEERCGTLSSGHDVTAACMNPQRLTVITNYTRPAKRLSLLKIQSG